MLGAKGRQTEGLEGVQLGDKVNKYSNPDFSWNFIISKKKKKSGAVNICVFPAHLLSYLYVKL